MKNDVRQVLPALRTAGYKVKVNHRRLTTATVEHMPKKLPDQLALITQRSVPLHELRAANLELSSKGGMTTVQVETPDGAVVATSTVICSIKDDFVRSVGLTKACGRLVGELQRRGIHVREDGTVGAQAP